MFKTRQKVSKCGLQVVDEHFRAFSLYSRACCFIPNISLLARCANLSYDEDEEHTFSAASAAFHEEVSTVSCLGYGFRFH